ncbi:MAG: AAA family ATPase [Myxococcota bacterium]
MGRIFVSYSHDDQGHINTIQQVVHEAGHHAWVDKRELIGGESWEERIEREIRDALCVLVIISEKSMGSKWVDDEIALAERLSKPIIPMVRGLDPATIKRPDWAARLCETKQVVWFNQAIGPKSQRALKEAIEWVARMPRSGKIVSFVNFKGGVGKTTLCALSGYFLAASEGKRVLFIDLDPQENLSDALLTGKALNELQETSRSALSLFEPVRLLQEIPTEQDFQLQPALDGEVPPEDILSVPIDLAPTQPRRLGLIPSDLRMVKFFRAGRDLHGVYRTNFQHNLRLLATAYDMVLLDCGPSASLLSHCALQLADRIVAPIRADVSATRGLVTMSRAARLVFDHNIDRKVHPVFNFWRGRAAEKQYATRFTANPGDAISRDLAFVNGQTLRTIIPQSNHLVQLNPLFSRNAEFLDLSAPASALEERLHNAGEPLRRLANEIIRITDGDPHAIQNTPVG